MTSRRLLNQELREESALSYLKSPAHAAWPKPATGLTELRETFSEFTSRAAEKLRKQCHLAGQILVFARTAPFREGPRFSKSVVVPLVTAQSRHHRVGQRRV